MHKQLAYLPAFVALTLAGCAVTPYRAAIPNTTANCVDDIRAVQAIPLARPAPEDEPDAEPVEFAHLARCLRTGASATPVALYRLDGVAPPAELVVSVLLSPGGTFAAAVEVLDTDFQPTRRYGFEEFVRRGTEYSLNVFLNETGKPPAYLMLLPDRSQAGKSDVAIGSTNSPIVVPVGAAMFSYNNGIETNTVRPFLEGGRVSVVVRPQGQAVVTGK